MRDLRYSALSALPLGWALWAGSLITAACGGGGGVGAPTRDAGSATGEEAEAEAEPEAEAEGDPCLMATCDDGIACTEDQCGAAGTCEHVSLHARCEAGRICEQGEGCVAPPPCATASDCPDTGPCYVAFCQRETATCAYSPLDGDGDSYPPQICDKVGGDDCNDADAAVYPGHPEECNGIDDDCDGQIDGFTRPCGEEIGTCKAGIETCEDGAWAECLGGVSASPERCDGEDNDCDGQTDEDFGVGEPCDGPDEGVCAEGLRSCDGCSDDTGDDVEVCDGSDNDCDGAIDEDFLLGEPCDDGAPWPCTRTGAVGCTGPYATGCVYDSGGPTEETCNSVDDDCNGVVDDGAVGIDPSAPFFDNCVEFGAMWCDCCGGDGACYAAVECFAAVCASSEFCLSYCPGTGYPVSVEPGDCQRLVDAGCSGGPCCPGPSAQTCTGTCPP